MQGAAASFLESHREDVDFLLSELVLMELYVLLRNPGVISRPLGAGAAVAVVERLRAHPWWQIVDHDPAVMEEVWRLAGAPGFARSRVFDARLGLGLVRRGVTHFATRNGKHFRGVGFQEVFDPLA